MTDDASCTSVTERIVDETVNQIRQLSESIDDPEKWRVLVPVEDFDEVKARLDTEYDLGTYYRGISLCYTDSHDVARVEYRSNLSQHERNVRTETKSSDHETRDETNGGGS